MRHDHINSTAGAESFGVEKEKIQDWWAYKKITTKQDSLTSHEANLPSLYKIIFALKYLKVFTTSISLLLMQILGKLTIVLLFWYQVKFITLVFMCFK